MKETWNGYALERLSFEGQNAVIVFPSTGKSNGRLAIKIVYWDAFPNTEIALLAEGFHLCFVCSENRWGTDPVLDRLARFVTYIAEKFNLSKKVIPVGMSCGGLIAIKFAAKYPELVSCLYLDAPVVNFLSCPCGFGVGVPLDQGDGIRELLGALGMESISQLISYREMPLDKLCLLSSNQIPMVMVAGGNDEIVPYIENGALLQKHYEETGVAYQVYIKPDCGHHPHGLEDVTPIINFILEH